MASAARREVGEEGEIELLTWGMRYAQGGKRVYIIACEIRAIPREDPAHYGLPDYQSCWTQNSWKLIFF